MFRCTNGGKANLTKGFCDCPPFFTGNRCEMVNCANGGINLPDGNECDCGLRYYGEFCEVSTNQMALNSMNTSHSIENQTFWPVDTLSIDAVFMTMAPLSLASFSSIDFETLAFKLVEWSFFFSSLFLFMSSIG